MFSNALVWQLDEWVQVARIKYFLTDKRMLLEIRTNSKYTDYVQSSGVFSYQASHARGFGKFAKDLSISWILKRFRRLCSIFFVLWEPWPTKLWIRLWCKIYTYRFALIFKHHSCEICWQIYYLLFAWMLQQFYLYISVRVCVLDV